MQITGSGSAVRDSSFELIAPHERGSIYVDFLRTHGEGTHHTCIAYATREALNVPKRQSLRARGEG